MVTCKTLGASLSWLGGGAAASGLFGDLTQQQLLEKKENPREWLQRHRAGPGWVGAVEKLFPGREVRFCGQLGAVPMDGIILMPIHNPDAIILEKFPIPGNKLLESLARCPSSKRLTGKMGKHHGNNIMGTTWELHGNNTGMTCSVRILSSLLQTGQRGAALFISAFPWDPSSALAPSLLPHFPFPRAQRWCWPHAFPRQGWEGKCSSAGSCRAASLTGDNSLPAGHAANCTNCTDCCPCHGFNVPAKPRLSRAKVQRNSPEKK